MAYFSTYTLWNLFIMKTFSTLLIFTGLLLSSFVTQSGIDEVIGALRAGNVSDLSKFIDESVEISLPEKSDSYSKAQAVIILKDFFSNNGVKSFDVKHKGDQGDGQFCIGTLQTRSGSYRTTVFMKMKGNKQIVREIRFQTLE